jgi:hypothetical protein
MESTHTRARARAHAKKKQSRDIIIVFLLNSSNMPEMRPGWLIVCSFQFLFVTVLFV